MKKQSIKLFVLFISISLLFNSPGFVFAQGTEPPNNPEGTKDSTEISSTNHVYLPFTTSAGYAFKSADVVNQDYYPLVEEFNDPDIFTYTSPGRVYISDGVVHWNITRSGTEKQYVYREIPPFSGDVKLIVRGQINSWTNNCKVRAGIGSRLAEYGETRDNSGVSINFSFDGGGCSTNGPNIGATGVRLDAQESYCNFTGNWLWINRGIPYTAELTISNGNASLSVPGVGTSTGVPIYEGNYNMLFVGDTAGGDWPSCSGTVDSMTVEPLVKTGISLDIDVPKEITVDENTGWYRQNPADLKVRVTNNTDEAFSGTVGITSSDSSRLVFNANDKILLSPISLNPGQSSDLNLNMWVQPMSNSSITFTANVFDLKWASVSTSKAIMNVPTAHIHPVVVVPGLFGSWKNEFGQWVIDPFTSRYDNLLEELRVAGYEDNISLFTYPYNWMEDIDITGKKNLGKKIDEYLSLASNSGRNYIDLSSVDIVSHSQGGLVSRAYIEGTEYDGDVNKLITLGTPHRGVPQAYKQAEGLQISDDILGQILVSVFRWQAREHYYCTWDKIKVVCNVTNPDLYYFIQDYFPSARELFPDNGYLYPWSYLIDFKDHKTIHPYGIYNNDFLMSLQKDIHKLFSRLGPGNVIAVAGDRKSKDTDIYYFVKQQSKQDEPLWSKGKVVEVQKGSGDKTVPLYSADLSLWDKRSITKIVQLSDDGSKPIEHGYMPTQLQQTVVDILTSTRPFFAQGYRDIPFQEHPTNYNKFYLGFYILSPVEVQIKDPLGRRLGMDFDTGKELLEIPDAFISRSALPDEPDFFFVPEPVDGEYQIELQGTAEGDFTVGSEFIDESGALKVAEFNGSTSLGALHNYSFSFDKTALPITPLNVEWYAPLNNEDNLREIVQNATLPIKFSIHDAQGNFVNDQNVLVMILDPTNPSSSIASFTVDSPGNHGNSDVIRINPDGEQYIVNLHLGDYNFEPGKAYTIIVDSLGQQRGESGFIIRDNKKP